MLTLTYSTLSPLPDGAFGNFLCTNSLGQVLACFPAETTAANVNVYQYVPGSPGSWTVKATFTVGDPVYDLLRHNDFTQYVQIPYLAHVDGSTIYVFFGNYRRQTTEPYPPLPTAPAFSLSSKYVYSTDDGATWNTSDGTSTPSDELTAKPYGGVTIDTGIFPPKLVAVFVANPNPIGAGNASIVSADLPNTGSNITWVAKTATGFGKQYACTLSCALNKIFAVGGMTATFSGVNEKVQFSSDYGDTWTTSGIADLPTVIRGGSSIIDGGFIHVFPGNGIASTNTTEPFAYGLPSNTSFPRFAYRADVLDVIAGTGSWESLGEVPYNDGADASTLTTFTSATLASGQVVLAGGLYVLRPPSGSIGLPVLLRSAALQTSNFCVEADALITMQSGECKRIVDIKAGEWIKCGDGTDRPVQKVIKGQGILKPNVRPRRVLPNALGQGMPNKGLVISGPHFVRASMDSPHMSVSKLRKAGQVEHLPDDECLIPLYQLIVSDPNVYYYANGMLISALGPEHAHYKTLSASHDETEHPSRMIEEDE